MASALLDGVQNAVRVVILRTPDEDEMDGVNVAALTPGRVTDVSPSIGSWLIAEGYAIPEMRAAEIGTSSFVTVDRVRDTSADRPRRSRRRSGDR